MTDVGRPILAILAISSARVLSQAPVCELAFSNQHPGVRGKSAEFPFSTCSSWRQVQNGKEEESGSQLALVLAFAFALAHVLCDRPILVESNL